MNGLKANRAILAGAALLALWTTTVRGQIQRTAGLAKPAAVVNGEAIGHAEIDQVTALIIKDQFKLQPATEEQRRDVRAQVVMMAIDDTLMRQFLAKTGIQVELLSSGTTELVNRLQAEGSRTAADVFLTNDAGSLARARELGMLLPLTSQEVEQAIPAAFRAPDNSWVGLSGRFWVIVYNTDLVKPSDLASLFDLADPKWKGKVGIPNAGIERIREYSPFTDERLGGGQGDDYLDWIEQVVKPMVDGRFRTITGVEGTGIAGSSLGGLLSLYAFFRQPPAYGFAGVLSPALWFAGGEIFRFVEFAPYVRGRVYLDVGTGEGDGTVANARAMRDLLLARGYRRGRDLMWVEDKGGMHNEAAWGRRLRGALPFLLRDTGSA